MLQAAIEFMTINDQPCSSLSQKHFACDCYLRELEFQINRAAYFEGLAVLYSKTAKGMFLNWANKHNILVPQEYREQTPVEKGNPETP